MAYKPERITNPAANQINKKLFLTMDYIFSNLTVQYFWLNFIYSIALCIQLFLFTANLSKVSTLLKYLQK